MITLREPILVSRKLAMRHEPDIGLRCRSTCSKITIFPMKNTRLTRTPSPHPCTPCVIFERPRVCRQNARMCFNMCAWCRYTRGRCGRTHTTHHTAHHTTTQHDTPHRTAPQQKQQKQLPTTHYPLPATHNTQHTTHNNTGRQRKKTEKEREREGEGRE